MSIAEDLVETVSLIDLTGDLSTFVSGIGGMFAEVEGLVSDTDTSVGWSPIWDVDTAPSEALPWLAQLVGEIPPAGASDITLRQLISTTPNQFRGTPQAIVNAIKALLTGTQTVGFAENMRSDGTLDRNSIAVFTYASQTPNADAVLGALRRTVPADINIDYQVLDSVTWTALQTGASGGPWTTIYAKYGSTWEAIEAAAPGYIIFST